MSAHAERLAHTPTANSLMMLAPRGGTRLAHSRVMTTILIIVLIVLLLGGGGLFLGRR